MPAARAMRPRGSRFSVAAITERHASRSRLSSFRAYLRWMATWYCRKSWPAHQITESRCVCLGLHLIRRVPCKKLFAGFHPVLKEDRMENVDTAIAVFADHQAAEAAVKKLAEARFEMKNLSIVGQGYHTDEKVVGFYNT